MNPIDDILRGLADEAEMRNETVEEMIEDFASVTLLILLRDYFVRTSPASGLSPSVLARRCVEQWRRRKADEFKEQLGRFQQRAVESLGPQTAEEAAPPAALRKIFYDQLDLASDKILKGLNLDGQ